MTRPSLDDRILLVLLRGAPAAVRRGLALCRGEVACEVYEDALGRLAARGLVAGAARGLPTLTGAGRERGLAAVAEGDGSEEVSALRAHARDAIEHAWREVAARSWQERPPWPGNGRRETVHARLSRTRPRCLGSSDPRRGRSTVRQGNALRGGRGERRRGTE